MDEELERLLREFAELLRDTTTGNSVTADVVWAVQTEEKDIRKYGRIAHNLNRIKGEQVFSNYTAAHNIAVVKN